MPTYRITIDGKTYRVDSPTELTDVQAYQAVQAEHEKSPDVLAAKNERLRVANAAPLREEQRTWGDTARSFVEGATAPGTYLAEGPGRVVEAAKAMGRQGGPSAQGVSDVVRGAGVAALPFAPAAIAAAPAAAIPAFLFGGVGAAGAGKVAEMTGADPGQTALAEDVGGLVGGGGGAALGAKVIKSALSRAVGTLRQPAAFMLEQAAEPLKASRALLRYGASKLRGGPDVGVEMGVSPRSLGATINEPVSPAPAAAPVRSIPPEPAAMRAQAAASQRDELGLPAIRPNAQGVQGADDLSAMRQELARRESAVVPPARPMVEPPMRRMSTPEPPPQGTINDLPLYRQQEVLQATTPIRPAPEGRPTTPIRAPQGTANDLPLYRQQEMLESAMGSRAAAPERPHRYAEPPMRPYEPSPALSPRSQVDIDAGLDDAAILRKIVQLRPNELAKYLQESPRAAALLEGGRVPSPGAFKPSALRSELTEPSINPKVMEQQFEQANPAFRAMEESGAFGGERTTGAIAPTAGVSTAGSAESIQGTRRMSAENERLASELAEKFKGKFTVEEIRTMLAYRNTAGLPKFGSRLNLFEEVLRRMSKKD